METNWKHYSIKLKKYNSNGTEWWMVSNSKTNRSVDCNSENAALKIVELAVALREGKPKPLNHSTLERKAKELEGFGHPSVSRYHTWDGKPRNYH